MINKERIEQISRFLNDRLIIHRNVENDTPWTTEEKMILELYNNYLNLLEENEKQKEVIQDLRKAIGRKEETIFELQDERVPYTNQYVDKIKNNWYKLEEYLLEKEDCSLDGKISFDDVLIKMQELEEGYQNE